MPRSHDNRAFMWRLERRRFRVIDAGQLFPARASLSCLALVLTLLSLFHTLGTSMRWTVAADVGEGRERRRRRQKTGGKRVSQTPSARRLTTEGRKKEADFLCSFSSPLLFALACQHTHAEHAQGNMLCLCLDRTAREHDEKIATLEMTPLARSLMINRARGTKKN